ncbi:MAG: formate dehydrogenase accessory protein FdhE [Acidobacteriota bacterium]|nr:formate dehydrogenase accessory protein FdhE [Acidobacteriota bacterium]
MLEPSQRPERPSDPVTTALRELRLSAPDLAPAADLQLELALISRRISGRAPLPFLASTPERQARLTGGTRVLSYSDLRFDWSDVRLSVREVTRALDAVGALQPADVSAGASLVRSETPVLERCLRRWFDHDATDPLPEGLHEALDTALRPFLARAASAALTGLDVSAWQRTACPACGATPDFAMIAKNGVRHLCCHRCRTQWPWHAWACPRCENSDQQTISSFATRDGMYRVYACGRCHRYLKAFDCRTAPRPFLPEVDLIATLPLDAAAMQKGFTS